MKTKTKNTNLENFTKLALDELELDKKVDEWSFKQLADYMIQEVWGAPDNKIGTLKCAVLDRVIRELFEIHDIHKIAETMPKIRVTYEN